MKLVEKLNELDLKSIDEGNKFYDLRNLYESTKLTAQDKADLKNLLNSTDDPDMVNAFLATKEAQKNEMLEEEHDTDVGLGKYVVTYTGILSHAPERISFDTKQDAEEFYNQLVGEGIDAELTEKETEVKVDESLNEEMSPEDKADSEVLRNVYNKVHKQLHPEVTDQEQTVLDKLGVSVKNKTPYRKDGDILDKNGDSLSKGGGKYGWGWDDEIPDEVNLADRARKRPERADQRASLDIQDWQYTTRDTKRHPYLTKERQAQALRMSKPVTDMKDALWQRKRGQNTLDNVDKQYADKFSAAIDRFKSDMRYADETRTRDRQYGEHDLADANDKINTLLKRSKTESLNEKLVYSIRKSDIQNGEKTWIEVDRVDNEKLAQQRAEEVGGWYEEVEEEPIDYDSLGIKDEALYINQPDRKIWKTVRGAIKATKDDDVDFQADNVMDNLYNISDRKSKKESLVNKSNQDKLHLDEDLDDDVDMFDLLDKSDGFKSNDDWNGGTGGSFSWPLDLDDADPEDRARYENNFATDEDEPIEFYSDEELAELLGEGLSSKNNTMSYADAKKFIEGQYGRDLTVEMYNKAMRLSGNNDHVVDESIIESFENRYEELLVEDENPQWLDSVFTKLATDDLDLGEGEIMKTDEDLREGIVGINRDTNKYKKFYHRLTNLEEDCDICEDNLSDWAVSRVSSYFNIDENQMRDYLLLK